MGVASMNAGVPETIRAIMAARGFKHRAIAQRAGIPPHDFSDMLNGRRLLKMKEVIDIAAALEVTPSDLFKTV